MALRFLQIGDTHLGAPLTGLPGNIADGLRQSVREALREAFRDAAALPVDVVLMPGDVFEQDGLDPAGQLRFVYELAEGIAPIPVVIAPGNHDSYSPQSPYATEPQPANVALFSTPYFSALETRAGMVVGRATQAGESAGAVDWSKLPTPPPAPGLLMLHASVLHAEDGRRHEQAIAPVSQQALEQCGYAYIALGHFHTYKQFQRSSVKGRIQSGLAFGAYAGCPQGQGWDEPGPKGYLVGQLAGDGATLEFKPSAQHIFVRRKLALPPEYAHDALQQLERSLLSMADELDRSDLFELTLAGRWPQLWRPELEALTAKALRTAWHARPAEFSSVQFTPPLIGAGESDVLDKFLNRCDDAISQGGGEEEAWRLARYLGHRLLSGQGLPGEVA